MMKKMILSLAFTMALAFTLRAQNGPGNPKMSSEEQAAQITRKMTDSLDLSESQQVKVKKVWTDFFDQLKAKYQQGNVNNADIQAYMETLEKQRDAEMKTILTGDQYKIYEEVSQKMKASRGGGPR